MQSIAVRKCWKLLLASLTKRFETLSASQCDCVENALSELVLPNYAEHLTVVMTIKAEKRPVFFENQVMLRVLCFSLGQGNTKRVIFRIKDKFLC